MAKASKKSKDKQPIDPVMQQNNEMLRDVEDSIRQDQLKALWDKYGSMAVTIAVGVVLITAAISGWNAWTSSQNKKDTTVLIEALNTNNLEQSLSSYIQDADGAHKTIASFKLAAEYKQSGQTQKATDLYKTIAQDGDMDDLYTDLATLLYATNTTGDEAANALEELADKPQSPWFSHAAIEYAVYLANQGSFTKSINKLDEILDSETTPIAIRQKAEALKSLYTIQSANQGD